MRLTMLFATLMLTTALASLAQNPNSQDTAQQQQQSAALSSTTTLTGCLKGSTDQYYIVEQNGHRHTLMASQDLSSYVNHEVTVNGKASRKAGTGSDAEGHRAGFFSVDSVSDQGSCKK
jgi:flagellar motor protein MotB